jgi:hypothetical protein
MNTWARAMATGPSWQLPADFPGQDFPLAYLDRRIYLIECRVRVEDGEIQQDEPHSPS